MNTPIENEAPKPWYVDSVLVKLSVITLLILLLLIPSSWIEGLINERQNTQQDMLSDISDKWSGSQLIQGPVLVLPYKRLITETDKNNKPITRETAGNIYILPDDLHIHASVKTEVFHRGIIDATVYNSTIKVQGNFVKANLSKLGIDTRQVFFEQAHLVFSLSDLKGLKTNPVVNLLGHDFTPEPAYAGSTPFDKGLQIGFVMPADAGFNFSYTLELKGTNQLSFLHSGKTTDVDLGSDWASPSFEGRYLPDTRHISNKGFEAHWHMLYFNRPFPQQWIDNDTLLTSKKASDEAIFGVKFSLPVDQYRKTMRTTKYDTLIILLTFVSLFLTEVIRKTKVHVVNYTLVGAAMVVYYILLLSFAEHIGYDLAYLIASVSTVALISWFTASLMGNRQVALLFSFILSVFYGFVYVIIQLEAYSLLIGSIELFIIVSLLMFFSRKINWEKH